MEDVLEGKSKTGVISDSLLTAHCCQGRSWEHETFHPQLHPSTPSPAFRRSRSSSGGGHRGFLVPGSSAGVAAAGVHAGHGSILFQKSFQVAGPPSVLDFFKHLTLCIKSILV